jgi:hypothetical protein
MSYRVYQCVVDNDPRRICSNPQSRPALQQQQQISQTLWGTNARRTISVVGDWVRHTMERFASVEKKKRTAGLLPAFVTCELVNISSTGIVLAGSDWIGRNDVCTRTGTIRYVYRTGRYV